MAMGLGRAIGGPRCGGAGWARELGQSTRGQRGGGSGLPSIPSAAIYVHRGGSQAHGKNYATRDGSIKVKPKVEILTQISFFEGPIQVITGTAQPLHYNLS